MISDDIHHDGIDHETLEPYEEHETEAIRYVEALATENHITQRSLGRASNAIRSNEIKRVNDLGGNQLLVGKEREGEDDPIVTHLDPNEDRVGMPGYTSELTGDGYVLGGNYRADGYFRMDDEVSLGETMTKTINKVAKRPSDELQMEYSTEIDVKERVKGRDKETFGAMFVPEVIVLPDDNDSEACNGVEFQSLTADGLKYKFEG